MTKQEIKDLIAAKIAGQGNQVDIGNALADVLNALADNVDAAQQAADNFKVLDLTPYAEQIENNEPIPYTEEIWNAFDEAVALKYDGVIRPNTGFYLQTSGLSQPLYDAMHNDAPDGFMIMQYRVAFGFVVVDTGSLAYSAGIIPCIVNKNGSDYIWFYYFEY